jgi:hypothetical protein
MPMDRTELHRLAHLGASARLHELEREREAIIRAFPDLRGASPASAAPTQARRRAFRMSAAQRRAVSARMKKYWAERRKKSASASGK